MRHDLIAISGFGYYFLLYLAAVMLILATFLAVVTLFMIVAGIITPEDGLKILLDMIFPPAKEKK